MIVAGNSMLIQLGEAGRTENSNDLTDADSLLMGQTMVLNGRYADLANRSVSNRSAGYFDAS
jgi:hypothetical protein